MNNNYIPKRNIPAAIKQSVRKRCGYGCVICGSPIFDYDHMKEWSKVHEHIADDITLLCPEHHREVTSNRMPRHLVENANKDPFNLRNGKSAPMQLYFDSTDCIFEIGSDQYSMDFNNQFKQLIAFMVDSIPLLSFIYEDGHLLLNVCLFDENNEVVLLIEDNQLVYSLNLWDITFIGNVLTLKEGKKDVLIEIKFETPNKIIIKKGRLLCNGVEMLINDYAVVVGGTYMSIGKKVEDCRVALVVGKDPYGFGAGTRIVTINRYMK